MLNTNYNSSSFQIGITVVLLFSGQQKQTGGVMRIVVKSMIRERVIPVVIGVVVFGLLLIFGFDKEGAALFASLFAGSWACGMFMAIDNIFANISRRPSLIKKCNTMMSYFVVYIALKVVFVLTKNSENTGEFICAIKGFGGLGLIVVILVAVFVARIQRASYTKLVGIYMAQYVVLVVTLMVIV